MGVRRGRWEWGRDRWESGGGRWDWRGTGVGGRGDVSLLEKFHFWVSTTMGHSRWSPGVRRGSCIMSTAPNLKSRDTLHRGRTQVRERGRGSLVVLGSDRRKGDFITIDGQRNGLALQVLSTPTTYKPSAPRRSWHKPFVIREYELVTYFLPTYGWLDTLNDNGITNKDSRLRVGNK